MKVVSKTSWIAVCVGLSFTTPASFAFASSEQPNPADFGGQSQAQGSSLLDKLYVNYFGIFSGPSVSQLGSPYSLDRRGGTSAYGINFNSELTTAYMVTPTIGVGPDIPFILTPVLGKGFSIGDVGIKAFNKKAISTRDFTLYASLYVQAPTSSYAQSHDQKLGIKMTPYFRYMLGGRWMAGMWTEEKYYAGAISDKMFKLYGAPYINYQLTPKLSLNLEYEYEAHHNVGDPGMRFETYQTDICPGLVWFISKDVIVNPYVQIFTMNQLSWDRTAVGAVISANLL